MARNIKNLNKKKLLKIIGGVLGALTAVSALCKIAKKKQDRAIDDILSDSCEQQDDEEDWCFSDDADITAEI